MVVHDIAWMARQLQWGKIASLCAMMSEAASDAVAVEAYSCNAFEDISAADPMCFLHICCYICFAQSHICSAI